MRFSLLKAIGGPGSPGFLLVGALLGYLLLRAPRTRRLGRWFLVALVATYMVLSLPVVATTLTAALPDYPRAAPHGSPPIEELIVLDGDSYRARGLTAGQVYAAHAPGKVWVLGGGYLRDEILAAGVPRDRWQWGAAGHSTLDQMRDVSRIYRRPDSGRKAIIVSRLQMPRVAALARKDNLDQLVFIPSPLDREPPATGLARFLPSLAALAVSRDAIYEFVALTFYRWRGWI